MGKWCIIFLTCLSAPGFLKAQESVSVSDFVELKDTKPVDQHKWDLCKKTFNSGWGSADIRYRKTEVPDIDSRIRRLKMSAWKGERANALALLWSLTDCKDVQVSVSALKASDGSFIPASAIQAYFVRYVMTDELNKDKRGTCGHRPDPTLFDSSMVADMLDVKNRIDIMSRHTQPVWIQVKTPHRVQSGIYRGKIHFKGENCKFPALEFELKVEERILPLPRDWSFWLDLWQNPYAVARYYQLPLWSEAHFEAMRPLMRLLADAGQKCITASIMHEPWGGQTEDSFESMVMRVKKLNGSWEYDYAVFDLWVEFMMSMGIDRQINCYSMIPWKLSFRYYDQASDGMKFVNADVGTPEYREFWFPFLVDFVRHLKAKGWFDITTIAMDERPMEQMEKAIALIREADPAYKIALAGNYHQELVNDIHDYSIASEQSYPDGMVQQRREQGRKSTFYTCCAESYPNMYTFSPPAEATWHAWFAAARGEDGYLRWAYNSWVKDPLRDSRFRSFGAGDCYQVYPGGRSSVRLEKLIEGIQDYEKIRILKEEFKNQPLKLKQLEEILSVFKIANLPDIPAAEMIDKARKELKKICK